MSFSDIKNKKEKAPSPIVGFVLLSEKNWDREKFLEDLKNDWGITLKFSEEKKGSIDILVAAVGNYKAAVSFMPVPVPDKEAERFAELNYFWRDAAKTVASHTAQILVSVLGNKEGTIRECANLYTQITDACLKQPGALAVYSDGTVYEPGYFHNFAKCIKHDEFPILNVVWLGILREGEEIGVYTKGLRKFGKEEMEVRALEVRADFNKLRQFLLVMVAHVLGDNVILQDGETIGFTAEQKLSITLTKSEYVHGDILRIEYGE